jgi:hypothetical protein
MENTRICQGSCLGELLVCQYFKEFVTMYYYFARVSFNASKFEIDYVGNLRLVIDNHQSRL